MNYELTKEDYEDIRVLIAITQSIFESNQLLAKLEIEGKKETSEYHRTIEQLKSSIGVETVLYGRISTEILKVFAVVEYLKKQMDQPFQLHFEVALQGTDHDMIIRRILKKITTYLSIKKEIKQDMQSLKETESPLNDICFLLEDTTMSLANTIELSDSVLDDHIACTLVILKKQTEAPEHRTIKSQLIGAKYRYSFIYPNIEETMLREHFEIPEHVYLQTKWSGQMQQQDDDFIQKIKQKYLSNIVNSQTDILLSTSDDVLKILERKAMAVLRIGAIRSGLLLLEDFEIETMNEQFHDKIQEESYLIKFPNNIEVEEMIRFAYRKRKMDRKIPYMVSFMR